MKTSTAPSRSAKSPQHRSQSRVHEETRQRLIKTAGEVFAECGFQAATVREICRRAGTNIAAVNYHFGDKLGLYTELLERTVDENEGPILASAVREPDAEEALRRFLNGMFRLMNQVGGPSIYVRVMTHELAQPSAALATVVERVIAPKANILHGIVGRIIDRPPDDTETRLCVHSIVGQIVHYMHARPVIEHLWPGFSMTPERIDQIANHVTEFSLCALRSIRNHPQGGFTTGAITTDDTGNTKTAGDTDKTSDSGDSLTRRKTRRAVKRTRRLK